jgi:hypothetical protein
MMRNLIHKPGTNCSAARRIWASGAESPSVAYAWGLFRDVGRRQMPTRKSSKVLSTAATKLLVEAAMGAAMGLIFGLMLVISNPAFAALIETQGNSTIWVFVGTFTTMFAIGAALTGAVFMSKDNEL